MINRKFFFDYVRGHLFDGKLRQSQVDGLNAILTEWERKYAKKDDRWLAYMLATTVIGLTCKGVGDTVGSSLAFAVFLDRLHGSIGLVMSRGEHVGEPAIIFLSVLALPLGKDCVQAVDLALTQLAVE